jgi:ribose-phosphate pyrophosphokinase
VAATHGIFAGPAVERLLASPIHRIVITDTVPLNNHTRTLSDRLTVLSVAPFLGEAIKRIHLNQSVSSLFGTGGNSGKR